MDRKKTLILTGLVLVICIFTALFFVITSKNKQGERVNELEIPSDKKSGESFIIETETEKIQINNIYKNGGELYEGGITFRDNKDFSITYSESDQSFAIVIETTDNLVGVRNKAEKELLDALGISKEKACELTVLLQVPYSVNPELSGTNYGLSFCPNGKYFEEIKGL